MIQHVTHPGHQVSDMPVVVFAEIDERFLGQPSSTALFHADEILAPKRIALVLYSSMTRAQIETVQHELGLREPFICESGAAILIPEGYFPFDVECDRDLPGYRVIELGQPHAEIVSRLRRTAERLETPIVSLSDQTVEQVAEAQGLSLAQARLAKLREYNEPFRLVHPTKEAYHRLWRSLRAAGLARTSSGTLEHVGAPVTKGAAISVLADLYRRKSAALVTVGLELVSVENQDRHLWIEAVVGVAERARDEARVRARN